MIRAVRNNQARQSAQRGSQTGRKSSASRIVDEAPSYLPGQRAVRICYASEPIQMLVAFLIFLNFLQSIAQAELNLDDQGLRAFDRLEEVFNFVFLAELLVNMYGSFFVPFWTSYWNLFDVIVVAVSLMSMYVDGLPAMNMLRLFRAMRVFRVLKRVQSLRRLVLGIGGSIVGVSGTLFLLALITSIWSIMGVGFFSDVAPEYYGSFLEASYTSFQIMTFDSWADSVARPILKSMGGGYSLYFISFIFVAKIIIGNVIVAVLLDGYLSTVSALEEAEREGDDFVYFDDAEQADEGRADLLDQSSARVLWAFDRVEALLAPQDPSSQSVLQQLRQENAYAKATIRFDEVEVVSRSELQEYVFVVYTSVPAQILVACLIFANFAVNVVEAQMVPLTRSQTNYFDAFDYAFNCVFLVELLANMYAHWWSFFANAWNWFDLIIVTVGMIMQFADGIPGLTVLRLLRAFRVFRLFRRVPSLRKIVTGVAGAMPHIAAAFALLFLIMGIWSIMGVDLFRDDEESREMFGDFLQAMFTLYQMMTYDNWADGIVRPILKRKGGWYAVYFMSFLFITSILMANVILAVLLDKYLSSSSETTMLLDDNKESLESFEKDIGDRLKELESTLKANNLLFSLAPLPPLERATVLQSQLKHA